MNTFTIYSTDGQKVGTVNRPALFETPVDKNLIHRYFLWVRTMMRNTLAHTKTRGEVSGGGKKPWKQKGTGRARSGSIRNPIWRHGGTIFGPRKEQTYETRMPRGERRKAMFSVLSSKAENVIILDKLPEAGVKTKEFKAMLAALGATDKTKVLQIHPSYDAAAFNVGRNIPGFLARTVSHTNVIDLLNADMLLMTKDALVALEQHFTLEV